MHSFTIGVTALLPHNRPASPAAHGEMHDSLNSPRRQISSEEVRESSGIVDASNVYVSLASKQDKDVIKACDTSDTTQHGAGQQQHDEDDDDDTPAPHGTARALATGAIIYQSWEAQEHAAGAGQPLSQEFFAIRRVKSLSNIIHHTLVRTLQKVFRKKKSPL